MNTRAFPSPAGLLVDHCPHCGTRASVEGLCHHQAAYYPGPTESYVGTKVDEAVLVDVVQATQTPRFYWDRSCGALTCDLPILGAQPLNDSQAQGYGGPYFVGETIVESMARRLCEALRGEWSEERLC